MPDRIIYCIVPRGLADRLHEPLRRHFAGDPKVEVIVERRTRRRRRNDERRAQAAPSKWPEPAGDERRRVRATGGRRAGERRVEAVPVAPPRDLPRRLRRYAEDLAFVERIAPSQLREEDQLAARLVARAQAGDPAAFSEIYTRYFDRVFGYMKVALRDYHEAEDQTQQVFADLLAGLAKYERRKQPFRAWLFTVTRNRAVDALRRSDRYQLADPAEMERMLAEEEAEPDEIPILGWIADRDLLLFVERLTPVEQQVLVMRYMLGLRATEMAAMLERTPADVRTIQARALNFLRARLAAVGRKSPADTGQDAPARRITRQAPVLRGRRFALLKR
jgi:RNA polymerase sigma-70 factor (ECF subfamily)